MKKIRFRLFLIKILLVFGLLITLPYVSAYLFSGEHFVFGGMLHNPLDGNSYLAKMLIGFSGDWIFKFPFTAHPGKGAFLFLFYIFLGHLAKLTNINLPLFFNMVRVLSGLYLGFELFSYYFENINDSLQSKRAFVLGIFGSGLGWVASINGKFTMDFWVAEAYPFLSSYGNVHFPFGLGLMIWMLRNHSEKTKFYLGKVFIAVLLLGIALPFGVIIIFLVLSTSILYEAILNRVTLKNILKTMMNHSFFSRLVLTTIVGLPILWYDFIITQIDPVFAGWNKQNLTITPGFWDVIISFSPVMLLAIPGLFYGIRNDNRGYRTMAIWAGIGLLLVFIPFSLQRRFFLGLYIPLAGLAILEIDKITKSNFQWGKYLFGSVFLMSIFTNIIVLLIGQFGVITHDNHLYLTTNEKTGLAWLNKNGEKGDVVLTGPETGLFVPAYTRLRVLYGHPFETLDAETMEQIVISIFKNELSDFEISKIIEDYSIDYIFVGPRENKLGFPNFLLGKTPAFQNDDVMIYAIFE